MNVQSAYHGRRLASELEEEIPSKRRRDGDDDVKQATAIVEELSEKAAKLHLLFDSIIRQHQGKVMQNPAFASFYIKLADTRHKLIAHQSLLQSQPQTASASILSKQNGLADTLLWLNKLELNVAIIVSQLS